MITNERQYRITRNKVGRFLRALEEFDAKGTNARECTLGWFEPSVRPWRGNSRASRRSWRITSS